MAAQPVLLGLPFELWLVSMQTLLRGFETSMSSVDKWKTRGTIHQLCVAPWLVLPGQQAQAARAARRP